MNKILLYIQERFPIVPVLLFAFGYAALATGISKTQPAKQLETIILFAGIFFFFLLRQRVVDEFKDSSHDLKNFPDRPVPRGLISKKQLVYLGAVALFLEWSLSLKTDGIVVGATVPEIIKTCHEKTKGKCEIYSPGVGTQGGDPKKALASGANYLIVGRTIFNAKDPVKEAKKLQELSFES